MPGFVGLGEQCDGGGDGLHRVTESQVGRHRVDGVATEHDEGLDLACGHFGGQRLGIGQGVRGGGHGVEIADRDAVVA